MQHEAIDGIVVRVRDTGDHDRYLSVLTAEKGRISMLSKGGRSMRSAQMAVSQLYTYGNFEFYRKGDFYILKGGAPIQPFYALSMDIDRLNLAAYLCDLSCELSDEGEEAGELLRLLLNSLYAVSKDLYPQELVKGAFELRAAVLSGYAPELDGCGVCGCTDAEHYYLDVMNGMLLCPKCLERRSAAKVPDAYGELREAETLCSVSPSVCAAMRYCSVAPTERLFSFLLKAPEEMRDFAKTAQTYLLSHLGRTFDSLDFYHSMRADAQ